VQVSKEIKKINQTVPLVQVSKGTLQKVSKKEIKKTRQKVSKKEIKKTRQKVSKKNIM
jgi:hypothetical protein